MQLFLLSWLFDIKKMSMWRMGLAADNSSKMERFY